MKVYEALYDVLWEAGLLNQVGKATGGSTTTVTDSILSLDTNVKAGGSILIFESTDGLAPEGEIKRVSSNTASTYTTETYSAAVGAGDLYAYIAKDLNVYELLPMVNMAMRKVPPIYIVDTSITTADNQREYTLPLTVKEGRIATVYEQKNTGDSDDNRWAVVYGWSVKWSAAGSTALLVFDTQPTAGRTIRIDYLGRHPAFTAFTDNINEAVPPELFKAAMKFQIDLMRNEEAIASQDGYRELYNAARDEFNEALRRWPVKQPTVYVGGRTFGRS
jgi:hypothetical protein